MVGFSTPTEIQTFAELDRALGKIGYRISQKTRVLDAIEAAAANPSATTTAGPSLADVLIPRLREAAGPLGEGHPWLVRGDWSYAFKAHFDFVVHAPLGERHATHPLFAVEFDGPSHAAPGALERDVRKNRLCAASGLPLVRLQDSHLAKRDGLSLIAWLASLWAAHRSEMPSRLAERDAAIAAMDAEQDDVSDMESHMLLLERPDLDVDLVFRLEHPFPPVRRLAERLARRYGFHWPGVDAVAAEPRWRVGIHKPPMPSTSGLVETWRCELSMKPSEGEEVGVCGLVDVATGYPLDTTGVVEDSWSALARGRLPYLPAGPFFGAMGIVGEALCLHNTLREVELVLGRPPG